MEGPILHLLVNPQEKLLLGRKPPVVWHRSKFILAARFFIKLTVTFFRDAALEKWLTEQGNFEEERRELDNVIEELDTKLDH